ncbi:hypothetical protein [Nocardia otitidiscaviarum]|uniref:hypothetical protein n=1 Tax=Nocardia otitidiscaviarum TaxID=1823 RepID=UPI0018943345|nr:hypothetical protein [Nocardia otitidiscaviarum]MBF6240079.1 hypothetical protein [Nocardia otitidiscaviarum]
MATDIASVERQGFAMQAIGRRGARPVVPVPMLDDNPIEPQSIGLYWDRDGDIWQREDTGWRLILQNGVSVDPISLWGWEDGCVRDYAPFIPVSSFAADG